jgi:nicotinamide-nucleotide amidase
VSIDTSTWGVYVGWPTRSGGVRAPTVHHPNGLTWEGTGPGTSVAVKDDDLTQTIAATLDGRTVAAAESCTAGRVVASLAGVDHASEFLCGGVVAYQEAVKRSLLGVSAPSIYSEAAVIEMARSVCGLLGSDVGVATSGVAGGDPVDGVRPGTVFVATVVDGIARSATHHTDGSPEQVCDAATRRALHDLLDALRATQVNAGDRPGPTIVANGRP